MTLSSRYYIIYLKKEVDLKKYKKKEIKKMTNLITKEVRKFIESKKESYSNMDERKWEVLEDKLVSEIEEASKELEADDTLEDLIENTLYYNSAMDEIIMRIAEN